MYLYHYFDKRTGPFKSMTALPEEEAQKLLGQIKKQRPGSMCAQRDAAYISNRRNCERILLKEFMEKGGMIDIATPFYMVVEHCPWLYTWYEQPDYLRIPIKEFDLKKISFTYGDSMPTFSPKVNDSKEYRRKVYTYDEILNIMDKYGLPQEWNEDGSKGPERYIEAHVWSNEVIRKYM